MGRSRWMGLFFRPATGPEGARLDSSLSRLTLVYWSMEGFDQVLWANASFAELLPTLGILAAITALVMSVAVWRFNKGRLFD